MPAPTEFGTFAVGAAVFPLVSPGTNTGLRDADPALYFALDYWAAMIRQHVGARLLVEAAAVGLSWPDTTNTQNAVRQQYPYDVGPYLLELQAQMPLLACWRGKSKYTWEESSYFSDECDITLAYVLPPLSAGQAERLIPFLRAIEATIRQRTTQAWDPSYTPPGGTIGDQFDSANYANVEEIGFNEGSYGAMPAAGNLHFPTLLMRGFVIERDNPVPGAFPPFAGGDVEVDLTADDLTTVPNIIDFSTQQAPTLASLDVDTGPIAGGTAVTITGTLFLPGPPMVLFGNTPATHVVWVSATEVTCVTPAVSGPGTLGVVLVNRDGQSASLRGAFAYT